jgi:hypothetical protein
MIGNTHYVGLTSGAVQREGQSILSRHSQSVSSQWNIFTGASSATSTSLSRDDANRRGIEIDQTLTSFTELSAVFSSTFLSSSDNHIHSSIDMASKIEKDNMFYVLIFKLFIMILSADSDDRSVDIDIIDDSSDRVHRFSDHLTNMVDMIEKYSRNAVNSESNSSLNTNTVDNDGIDSGNINSSSGNNILSSNSNKLIDDLTSIFCESLKIIEKPNLNLQCLHIIHNYIFKVLIKSINSFIAGNFNLLKKVSILWLLKIGYLNMSSHYIDNYQLFFLFLIL